MSTSSPGSSLVITFGSRARRSELGASLVEYTLLVAFIALVCFSAIVLLGSENQKSIEESSDSIVSSTN